MSYSASVMGLPEFRHSRLARLAASLRTRSASRNRIRPRSWAVVWGHGPESNAARAAATARFTSFSSASGTSAITCSVDGSYTGKNARRFPSTNSLLMYSLYLCAVPAGFAVFTSFTGFDFDLLATDSSHWKIAMRAPLQPRALSVARKHKKRKPPDQ